MNTPAVQEPVYINAGRVKRKFVDFPAEMFSCLDAPRKFGNLSVLTPTVGVFALWELASCDFFQHPFSCSARELGRAVWISNRRKAALPAVLAYVYDDDSTALDRGAAEVLQAGGDALFTKQADLVTYLHTAPWQGFAMIPKNDDTAPVDQFLFNGFKIGVFCYLGSRCNLTAQQVLWEVPAVLLGHLTAACAQYHGTEGIGRPYDEEDIKHQLAKARAEGTGINPVTGE